ncbi:hypothetical protein HPB49_009275 [Dermacentor silvarum]|uniref:Uncharacterized protein n=1 Tax=Dermacentor silvarum TaxID=543639 RepID=A0ACB8DC40_DERSI|nr:hypothetical protein HPB49_009275 [Dermacentor silvarum]
MKWNCPQGLRQQPSMVPGTGSDSLSALVSVGEPRAAHSDLIVVFLDCKDRHIDAILDTRSEITEQSKIIIRPRGGLNLSKVSTTSIGVAVIEASGLTPEQAREDVVCPNFTQNIVVVSKPDPSQAARYVPIKSIIIAETEYEVNAYETAPHTT